MNASSTLSERSTLLEHQSDVEKIIEPETKQNDRILFKLREVCKKIQQELHSDFVAIQWIREEERIIEVVAGVEWVGLSRHYLERDPELRDIQADIAKTFRTEIIAGWDKRFDSGIYKEEVFGHSSMVRIFTLYC